MGKIPFVIWRAIWPSYTLGDSGRGPPQRLESPFFKKKKHEKTLKSIWFRKCEFKEFPLKIFPNHKNQETFAKKALFQKPTKICISNRFKRPQFHSPVGRWSILLSTPQKANFFPCFLLILWILQQCLGPWTFWMNVFEQMQNTHLGQCYLWNQLFVFKKKRIYESALQTGRKLGFFPRKKSSPLRFCFTKYFATLWKSINMGQCYLWKQRV